MPRKKTIINNFTDTELENEIRELNEVRTKELEEHRELSVRLQNSASRLRDLRNEQDTRIIESGQANWDFLLDAEYDNQVKYRELQRRLREIGLGQSGYHPDTNQYCIQVLLYKYAEDKDERLSKTMDGFKEVLPYLKPNPETNEIHVNVLEAGLSEYGSCNFYFKKEDDKYFGQIRVMRGYRTIVVTEWLPLDEFWPQAAEDCPYDRPDDDEEDEW